MIFLSVPLVVLSFMLGGQINKLFRPIGATLSIMGVYAIWYWSTVLVCLPTLGYAVTLSLGYGEDSKLMKLLKSEQKVRIVLGLLNTIPVVLTTLLVQNWVALFFVPIIVAVECIRMGSWGKIGKYDILPVDIFRGLAVGIGMAVALA